VRGAEPGTAAAEDEHACTIAHACRTVLSNPPGNSARAYYGASTRRRWSFVGRSLVTVALALFGLIVARAVNAFA